MAWKQQEVRCWLCRRLRQVECHEIARGPHRAEARQSPAAWLAVCRECHAGEIDAMPIPKQLALKKLNDTDHYDRLAVNRLRRRADGAVTEAEVDAECLDILRSMTQRGVPLHEIEEFTDLVDNVRGLRVP